jgi:multidrug transporter EmrE-like cation transporter
MPTPTISTMNELGLILAFGCALVSSVSLLCKYRGANHAPDVVFSSPLRSASALFRSGWWTMGFGLASLAWCLHMAALSMAPLSLVQAVIAGGLALLALPARRWFGISIGPREMIGLGLSAAGLAFLALTAGQGTDGAGSTFDEPSMLAFEASAIALGGALMLSSSHPRIAARLNWFLLAAAAGVLLGVANVALKTLAETVPGSPASVLSPLTLVAVVAGAGTFLAFARALQLGDAVAVIVVSSAATTLSAVIGGILVYSDPLGSDPMAIIARSSAFLAVIAAAALLPMVPADRAEPAARTA